MKLHTIAYTEFENEIYEWQLDEFELSDINLVVGKNATGKSRLLRIINGFAAFISGAIQPNAISSGKYTAVFIDPNPNVSAKKPDIKYSFSILAQKVIEEELIFGGEQKFKRQLGGRSKLFFEEHSKSLDVQIPDIHLAASARRDQIQHPYFEPLHKWASKIKYFAFTDIGENKLTAFEGKIPSSAGDSIPFEKNLHVIAKLGKDKFGHNFESSVLSDMRKIGYDITEFGLTHQTGLVLPLGLQVQSNNSLQTLYVKEKDIEKKIYQHEISDGIIRALGTLIYLNFSRLNKNRDSLLIDDIGEGLDFERASKLVSILISEAEKGFIQLILTTNDRFIMNNVPLKYWSVLQRDKGKVSVFNHHNSETAFLEFEQYGFNNFDFFSKGYFSKGKKENVA
jgi:predicted ATPase